MRTLRLLMVSALAVVLSAGCASRDEVVPSSRSETVNVRVIATQPGNDCKARFPAQQNACRGVTGEADGLACAARGDVVVWKPGNPVTGISSVEFVAGNDFVCGADDLRQPDGSYRCVLQPRPKSEAQGLALKYVVGVTFHGQACPKPVDPYVIIVYR